MLRTDICIAGAGIIGVSLALELQARGLSVIVLEAGSAMQEATTAAAGMLAADDPHNPPELSAVAQFSMGLYPAFLDRIAQLSGIAVPFQTTRTLQSTGSETTIDRIALANWIENEESAPPGFKLLRERSIDPRQLAASLLAAVNGTAVQLFAHERVATTQGAADHVRIRTTDRAVEAAHFVDCTGAWVNEPAFDVVPIKGQMLAVAMPADFPLKMSVRTGEIYIVPRTVGPNAGRAIIGATIEDVGFDKTVDAEQIAGLHRQASALLPPLASAIVTESWTGLRPATPDRLPLIGRHPSKPRHWIAAGHYRNGILLAPATARAMAQLLLGHASEVSLDAFSPSRAALPRPR